MKVVANRQSALFCSPNSSLTFLTADVDRDSSWSARHIGTEKRKARKAKQQIHWGLAARPKNGEGTRGSNYTAGLTERLVRTPLLVSAGAFSDGRQAEWLHLEDSCESLLTVFSGCSSAPPRPLKNGAFDGRRENHPDYRGD